MRLFQAECSAESNENPRPWECVNPAGAKLIAMLRPLGPHTTFKRPARWLCVQPSGEQYNDSEHHRCHGTDVGHAEKHKQDQPCAPDEDQQHDHRNGAKVVLCYGVSTPLRDPILDRVPIRRTPYQIAALHQAIEGYANGQFTNIAS
jgi:hypothetical protein